MQLFRRNLPNQLAVQSPGETREEAGDNERGPPVLPHRNANEGSPRFIVPDRPERLAERRLTDPLQHQNGRDKGGNDHMIERGNEVGGAKTGTKNGEARNIHGAFSEEIQRPSQPAE